MRLVLTPPPTWRLHASGGQHLAYLDDVVLAWGGLVPLPHDRSGWMVRALSVDVESTASLRAGDVSTRATSCGWPVRIAMATVVRADEMIAEYRLGAFYSFLEYGAVALARSRSRVALESARAQLDDVLMAGAPAWDAPSCLHDLFG